MKRPDLRWKELMVEFQLVHNVTYHTRKQISFYYRK